MRIMNVVLIMMITCGLQGSIYGLDANTSGLVISDGDYDALGLHWRLQPPRKRLPLGDVEIMPPNSAARYEDPHFRALMSKGWCAGRYRMAAIRSRPHK